MTATSPQSDTARWRALDAAHHLHPFSDTRSLNAEGVRVITRAEGCWLWDSEGNRILDGMAGLWCVNIGYGRKALAEAAYRQLQQLPYYNAFFKTAAPATVELADLLCGLAPAGLNRALFANSGSEANDSAIRLIRHYWMLAGQPEKRVMISREYAYHGSTMASASLGGLANMHAQGGLPLPDFAHVAPPYWYGRGGDLAPDEFGRQCARTLEDKILELGPERVAAFFGEPVMGAGGVLIPPQTYWPEVQRICRKYDVLLVADEVICGFGRLGSWWGCDRFAIAPDLLTLAKGVTSGYLPLSAVLVGDRVADLLIGAGGEFAHGFTYSGHPAACAVALENIRILREEGLVEQVAQRTGPYLAERLAGLADHPLVGEVRMLGFIGGIELVADKAARRFFEPRGRVGLICRDHCFANGLVMRAVRDTMVLAPPLIMTEAEIDTLVERARTALDRTWADLRAESA